MEPLEEGAIKRHLSGEDVLGTYVQRPNHTAKYLIFDVDISKKVLLQYSYGSEEFKAYKQKAAKFTDQICRILKKWGLPGMWKIQDTGDIIFGYFS